MRRTIACLTLGVVLWVGFGAVRGASYWQVSANGYLVGLIVLGAAVGAVAPGPHLWTGLLLVAPGVLALISAQPDDHPDGWWWVLTMGLGACAAAASHRLTVSLRRRFGAWRP